MLAWPSAVGCCFLFFFFKLIWFQSPRTNVWNTEFIFICLHYTFGRTQPSEFRGKKWGRFHLLSCLEAKRQLAALQFVCFATILLFCCSVMSDCLWPQGLQHARLLRPSPTPGACSNSCPSSQWWKSLYYFLGFPGPPASAADLGSILGQEDVQEKRMVTHSSILSREISLTEEPGGL